MPTGSCIRLLRRQPAWRHTGYVFGPPGGQHHKNVSSRFRGVVSRGIKAAGRSEAGAISEGSRLHPFRFPVFCLIAGGLLNR